MVCEVNKNQQQLNILTIMKWINTYYIKHTQHTQHTRLCKMPRLSNTQRATSRCQCAFIQIAHDWCLRDCVRNGNLFPSAVTGFRRPTTLKADRSLHKSQQNREPYSLWFWFGKLFCDQLKDGTHIWALLNGLV